MEAEAVEETMTLFGEADQAGRLLWDHADEMDLLDRLGAPASSESRR